MSTSPSTPRYVAPTGRGDIATTKVIRWLTEHGVSVFGSRVLTVRGRKSGTPQQIPVNLMPLDGERYLVSPRGITQWVRNARAAEEVTLGVGQRVEHVRLVEVPVEDRVPVLRVYLDRWGWEVGRFVEGLTKDSTDAELAAEAAGIPAFKVVDIAS
ncbi:nitroreductase/quinone reductase family protein [Lapillicoccus sp.]|uniref:nitroreductase/quinone reductase family protein n=1 Tax=Lapillicoccus sp. TaxID=1909287 RepID=UPI003263A095